VSETTKKVTHFVAFGRDPGLPGHYDRRPTTPFEVPRFCGNDGDGFWSLVRRDHPTLICIETLRKTVTNVEKFGSKNRPDPVVGDEVLVVIPPEGFALLDDKAIEEIDWGQLWYDRPAQIPIPACELEIWTRIT
jgi:hypothetical protein